MTRVDRTAPRTVIRPAGAGRGADLPALGRPLIGLAAEIERAARPDPTALAAELRTRVAGFETAAHGQGLRAEAILDARDALVAVVDARARSNPALDAGRWGRALRAAIPGAVPAPEEIGAAAGRAASRGERDLARFLEHCREAAAGARPAAAPPRRWAATLAVAGFLALLLGWAGWVEWRYRERLLAGLPEVGEAIAAGQGALPVAAAELDVFAAAAARVERDAAGSPLGLVARLPGLDPGAAARERMGAVAGALVPGPLAEAMGVALATEGEALALYDTLRAAAILEGRAAWQPGFLRGWIAARATELPDLAALGPHVLALVRAPEGVAVSDPETRAEARRFAAEGGAAERAYLELERSEAAAVPDWSLPAAVPGAASVLVRRSGAPIEAGMRGLYTAAGWESAEGGAAAAAVARAAAEGASLIGDGEAAAVDAVLDRLQVETLLAWRGYLADLRVRPFTDQPGAVMITGALGVRETPLAQLIREVWRQTGGEDRGRSHANQLRIAAEFGPAIQFVEAGRMAEIARLFASLNVALQVLDGDADLAAERLMDVQARAASIAALSQAPPLVAGIIEDVLAQTAASSGGGRFGNRAVRLWQGELGPACAAAVDGRYPFAAGPDADPAAVAALLGPEGRVARFFAEHLAAMMETAETPWRWKPEARLSGFDPESAVFFQRVAGLGPAFGGGVAVGLTALAQRGAPQISIGGAGAPVVTSGAPVALRWPGPQPERGLEIAFDSGERGGATGHWGMLRFLDGVRLRPRLDGRRFLIDLRLGGARAYLQMDFEDQRNPVTLRPLLAGLSCPPAL